MRFVGVLYFGNARPGRFPAPDWLRRRPAAELPCMGRNATLPVNHVGKWECG
jgi:hypothetical protein